MVRKLPSNFFFGPGSCLISDLARPNSDKAVSVQVFLRFEILIFNKNFVFCMMSSFCSMTRKAGWILAKYIIKCTNVFYPICLQKYWKKLDKCLRWRLFCESCAITHHCLINGDLRPKQQILLKWSLFITKQNVIYKKS